MSVTETKGALGSWSLKLRPDTPRSIIDAVQYFGHIVVSTGRPDPRVAGDTLLRSGRYTGVLLGKTFASDDSGYNLSGAGMAYWLGDANNNGPVITTALTFTNASFTSAVNAMLPASGAVTAGTIHSVTGAYTGLHQWQTSRKALDLLCSTMTSDYTNPVEYRVNGDATLDAGLVSDLYVTSPIAAVVRRDVGADMGIRALPGKGVTTEDVQDFVTEVILLAQGSGQSIATGAATISPALNPYLDLHGNPVSIISAVSQSSTDPNNANAQAAVTLNTYSTPRKAIRLSSSQFDIRGDVAVGDWVWVHDPDAGLVDTSATPAEIVFRGQRINPTKLRVTELSWPVTAGMSVAYRDYLGNWFDLTDYVIWETGDTNLIVGGFDRSLTNPNGESIGTRPMPNTSIPGAPTLTTPFTQSVYQSTNSGITKAQVQVTWTRPLNTDGSAIIDGDHYEIQYRTSSTPIFPSTHAQMAAYTHAQLHAGTNAQPITYTPGPWQTAYVGFDSTQLLIQELTPGVPYDIQVRAVDNGTPPNAGAWSATTTIQTVGDTIAPSVPAPPSVAASRIAIQVTHTLGKSSGGTYNLEPDLHHLEIHAQYEPTFTPTDSTLLGKLIANNGMILANIPAVGTFQVESTNALYFKCIAVDEAGNKSNPSTAVQATALLIDNAHISDLTVTKVTAGTISADWFVGARIKTADSGARVELNSSGLQAYNGNGVQTVAINSADGSATLTGTVQSGVGTGSRVILNPSGPTGGGDGWPTIDFYPSNSSNVAFINAPDGGAAGTLMGMNSGTWTSSYSGNTNRTRVLVSAAGAMEVIRASDQARDGGFVNVDASTATLGINNIGQSNGYIEVFRDPSNEPTLWVEGHWPTQYALDSRTGVYTGSAGPYGAGPYFTTYSYGPTMVGSMLPIVSVLNGSTAGSCCLTGSNSAGFTIGIGSGATASTYHLWWVPRGA
jgi:hypothetical protein